MTTASKAMYAIACSYLEEDDFQGYFFVTFNTRDEKEAMNLAKCVCGKKAGPKSLVVVDSNGGIWT